MKISLLLLLLLVFTPTLSFSQMKPLPKPTPEDVSDRKVQELLDKRKQLTVLGISMFLFAGRNIAPENEMFEEYFYGAEMVRLLSAKSPRFGDEFSTLGTLEKLPAGTRFKVIDKALYSIKAKLNETEQWQFAVGKEVGNIMAQLTFRAFSQEVYFRSRVDESSIKLSLKKLDQLLVSAPSDFPFEVQYRLTNLAALGNKDRPLAAENLKLFDRQVQSFTDAFMYEYAP